MTDESTLETTLAVLVSKVEDLRTDVAVMRQEQTDARAQFVPRAEWVQRNQALDERDQRVGREIADLRTELRSRRVAWPAVLGAVTAAAALGLTVVQAIR